MPVTASGPLTRKQVLMPTALTQLQCGGQELLGSSWCRSCDTLQCVPVVSGASTPLLATWGPPLAAAEAGLSGIIFLPTLHFLQQSRGRRKEPSLS